VVDRVGKGIRTPPRDALIAEITPLPVRGRAFGFHRGADHFGAVLGSVAAWFLLERGADVRAVISWSVAPGVAAFVILAVVLRGRSGGQPVSRSDDPSPGNDFVGPPARLTARRPGLWPALVALTALTFFRLPETLLILRLQDCGVSVTAIPLIWAALHVVRSGSSYPGGWLSDRLGPRRVVAAGGLLFAAVAFGLGIPLSSVAAVALFLGIGLVAGLTESGERAVVARLAPVTLGRGYGAYHGLLGAAALPAGVLFGALYQSVSGQAALWASAAGMVAAVVGWLIVPIERGQQIR
jgi:MFS family permease